jgi:hypothetical protein
VPSRIAASTLLSTSQAIVAVAAERFDEEPGAEDHENAGPEWSLRSSARLLRRRSRENELRRER